MWRQFSLRELFRKFSEAETHGFPRVSKPNRTETASRRKLADFVAEDPVSCELVSDNEFPDIREKCREIRQKRQPSVSIRVLNH
jgi:hypothetical protein